VVILMQENRSFDHYSGTMAGVRGFNDLSAMKLPNVNSVFQQPYSGHPDGFLLPFRYNAGTTNAQATPGLPHDWSDQHDGWNHGKMDNWIPREWAPGNGLLLAQGHSIPLRDYHCSVLGPTNPNRLFARRPSKSSSSGMCRRPWRRATAWRTWTIPARLPHCGRPAAQLPTWWRVAVVVETR
jgi:phospholipase C